MLNLKTFTLLLAGLAYSSAISNFNCARYCKETTGSFGYEVGKTYKYQYSGNARSLVNTTSQHVVDQSGVSINGVVAFQSLSNCDYIMEILEVTITDYHIKSSTKTTSQVDKFQTIEDQLKANPLYFAFNGKIDTICPDKSESKEIIDIKRGILSVFQNNNPLFKENALVYETDITGNCETQYKVTTNQDGVKQVNKTKNLDACDHRMSNYFSWQTVPYTTTSSSKSIPLLKSTLNCMLTYVPSTGSHPGDILLESSCFEKHVFQPFSNGDNGAMTKIEQELKFIEVLPSFKRHNAPNDVVRSTLIYEYKEDKMAAYDGTKALGILKELEDKTADGVDMDVPGIFSQLVFEFQRLSKTNLLEIFKQINQKQRIFFIDAISLIKTNSGIEVMSDLYANKKLSDKQMNTWLISINFIKNPNKQTVKLLHPLTWQTKLKQNAMLSLSSVLYKYCSRQNCLDDVVILEIVKTIEKPISNNCLITSENDKKDIFLALKSIGNAGLTSSYYNLQNCYLNNELPIELRLAAIAAHRRMKCVENENLDDFKKLLSNSRTNSEIRIASYLAAMQCASYASFAQVKDVLMNEEANQVGSFIWTHLTNLQETSVPWKQGVKKLLENEFLQNKFNTDIRKYSRNYEASTFFDSIGAGGGVEANVIFSSESYLPRSAMLNFTLDLFGETINVLELGTRIEGFEDIVENLFTSESDTTMKKNTSDPYMKGTTKQEMIDGFVETFKVLPKQPSGTGYIKIFGNEISYTDFPFLKDLFGMSIFGKTTLDMLLQFIKTPEIDYTKSFSLLDSTYKIPTILGFPLQLKSNATATIGLTAGGEINMKDIRKHKMLVKGQIYPSVSVQVASTMGIDTYIGETGVQYLGALKSNMYIDGYLNLEMGKVVDVKINVPKKQMDIFTVTSDLYIVHNEDTYLIQDVTNKIDNSEYCTDQYISKLIGLQFCNQWKFVNSSSLATPNFPLTGSFKYSMHIKKTDTFDFYKLYIETKLTDPNRQYLIDFLLDTPNSKVDRKLQCTLSADLQAYKVNIKLHSPFANFHLDSNIERELPKYKFQLMTTFNDKEVVTLLSTFDVKDEGETVTYEPLAKINYKQQQIVALTGKLSRVKSGEYTADLKLQGVTNEVAQIYGSFTCGADSFRIKTNIMSTHFKGNLEAGLNVRANEVLAQGELKYNYNNLIEENLKVLAKFNRTQSDTFNKNLVLLDLNSSEWPGYNTHVQWENQRGHLYFNNTAEIMFFETTWRTHQILKLDKGFYDEEPDLLLLADLQSPENNIDYQSKLQFNMSKKHLRSHALFQLNKIQRTEALLDYKSNSTEDTVNILLYYAKKQWSLDGVLNKHLNRNYNFDINCRYKTLDQEHIILTLKGDYKNASLGEMQTHRLNCTLDLPETNGEWRTPWVITSTVQKSHTTFLSLSRISTKEADYVGHFNWIEDSLSLSIQANDKQLFVLNGARTEELISVIIALNIHQHFELNTKLMMPYQRFDLQVYWDKDRDETQRFIFFIEQNSFKGQYNMEVEYPNQRISTNILLVPTQVIMNVTWGIKVSQRIYLKIGNKYYDVGGIWFGELETPFRYLEKQQFNLQYAVLSDSFDVQSDLSWRSHNINLLIAGSRSDTHLKANLQLNTTLPEIRKVGAALSHTHKIALGNYQPGYDSDYESNYQSNAAFDYYDHSIQAESRWLMKGDKVDSRFRIESPTDTIEPIFGSLNLNNNIEDNENTEGASTMDFVLSWQKKNITAMYNFKSDTSSIEIITPFEGIEKTIMKYSVVTNIDSVYLSTTVDVFKQNNSITLSWTNTDEVTSFWLDLMSPMTGGYYVYFTHSVLLGKLNENFKIRGPENKDLMQMKIEGDIMPLLEMNLTASLILLDHDAKLTIINSKEPLFSNIIGVWNGRTINSKIQMEFEKHVRLINWLIESNIFAPVNISYERDGKDCVTKIILPNNYSLINRYAHSEPYLNNEFHLNAPKLTLEFDYKSTKNTIDQKLFAQLNEKKVDYSSKLFTKFDVDKEIKLLGIYNFYQDNQIVHSYNMTTEITQNNKQENFYLGINSTSSLNGHFKFNREISPKISGNSFKLTCKYPSYCNLDASINNQSLLWNNIQTNKKLHLTYKTDDNSLTTKLDTNYENIPNGDLHLQYFADKLNLNINTEDYNIYISSDANISNATAIIKKHQKDLVKFLLEFKNPRKLNASLNLNTFQKLNATFSYDLSPKHIEIQSMINSAMTKAHFTSKFQHQQDDHVNGLIECRFNEKLYSSTIKLAENQFTLFLKTPTEEYNGKMKHSAQSLFHIQELELSTLKSKNSIKVVQTFTNIEMIARLDYFELPKQEIFYSWDAWSNFSGEGYYKKGGSEKHTFTVHSTSLDNNWSLAWYLPSGVLFFNAKLNSRYESENDFDFVIDGSWDNRKFRFDLKNYFGEYYQTTFNLITPFKGWGRTSLDCTLNDQKIGIALQAKSHYMSVVAGSSGDDMLRIEYMGETLMEMSSSEGHLTLRTTSYLGKYRLFIQVTQTPGIYVFSILKDGENLISFMLQNYSINEVMHYKGKLMAPEIIPNNSTISVEFMANLLIWKMFDFKMKRDHKPLLELGWENTRHKRGGDWSLRFQSQIDPALNFKLRPSFSISEENKLDIDVEVRYPCQKHTECSFTFVLVPNRMVCNSLSSVDIFNFHIQSNFNYGTNFLDTDFEFNDFKHTNIELNISTKLNSHMKINGTANFKEQSAIVSLNLEPRYLQMEIAGSQGDQKYYLLAKSQLLDDHVLLDLHLAQNQYFPNITTKADVSLQQGLVIITRNKDKYETTWLYTEMDPRVTFTGHLKRNGQNIGDVTFSNIHIKGHTFQSDNLLHLNIKQHKIKAVMKSLLSNDSAKATFTLQTPWEPMKKVNSGIDIQYSSEKFNLEQFLGLSDKEFKLNANGVTTRKGMILKMSCKPWGQPNLVNQTISANLKYDFVGHHKKATYNFDIDLGDSKYHVRAQPGSDGYTIEVKTHDEREVAMLKFNKNLIDFKVNSIGIIESITLKLNSSHFILGSNVKGYKQLFFANLGAFGLFLEAPEKKNKIITILYKIKGHLPNVNLSMDSYTQYKHHDVIMVVNAFDNLIKFTYDEHKKQKNKSWMSTIEFKTQNQKSLVTTIEENDSMYKISTNPIQHSVESLIVYKTYQRIKNEIYLPFEVEFNTQGVPIFNLKSEKITLTFTKGKQHVNINYGDNHFRFDFDHIKDNELLVHYQRNDQILHFEVGPHQNMKFNLNQGDLLSLNYDIHNGLVITFKHLVNNQKVRCNLSAASINNISFDMTSDEDQIVLWESSIDDSSISYKFIAPKWDLLRLFDIALSWENNTRGKVFGASLKLDSEYTGLTEAGTVYEQRQFLLNIVTYFKAPFLKGLETFYGKVYIPKEFRPHLEVVIPGHTYKFYCNHWNNVMETEVICSNEHFSLMFNTSWSSGFTIQVEFPGEQFKSLLIRSSPNDVTLIEVNDEYSVSMKTDFSYLKVKTPLEGYEKFGFLCEQNFDNQHGKFKFVIVHPGYEEPLGIAFIMDLEENKSIEILYSIHTPFTIEGYDYVVINMTAEFLLEGIDTRWNLMTNEVDLGGHFGLILNDNRKFIKGEVYHNTKYFIASLNIEPTKIYLIFGNPNRDQSIFLDKFPEFNKHISENLHMIYLSVDKEENIDLLVHLGPQPFSLQRNGNTFIKLIWDLRNANKTRLGIKYIPQKTFEVYLLDNQLTAEQNTNKSSNDLYIKWNDLNVEYSSSYTNVSIQHDVHNVTTTRKVQTPFGRLHLTQSTSTSTRKLMDCVEIDWASSEASKPSKLIFNYEITPGTLTSTMSSSLLEHPMVLNLDMSEFRSIPSKLDASFVYSNITEKTINFSMRYNKTFSVNNDVESVFTDRVFILKHPSSKVDYELYFNAIRMDDFSNGSVMLKYKNFDTNKLETIHSSVKVDHSKFGVHAEVATSRNRFDLMATSTTGVKRHGFLVHVEINDKDPLNLECNYNFQKDSPSVSLMAAYGTSRKYVFYAGMPNEKEITAKLGHESYGRASLDALAIMKLNTSQLLWMKVLWKDNLYAPFHEAILDEYNDMRYVIEAMGKELIDVIHDDVGKDFITDFTHIKSKIVNNTIKNVEISMTQLQKRELCSKNFKKLCEIFSNSNFALFLKENLRFFDDILEHIIKTTLNSIQILFDAINVEVDNAMKGIKNIQHIKIDAKSILKRGINTARKSLKDMETVIVKLLDDFDLYISSVKNQVEEFFEPFLSLVDDFIVYVEQRLAILQIAVLDTMDSIQQYIYNLREIKAMFSVYYSYINWLEELHIIKMLDPVTDVIEELLETIIQDVKRILDHYKPYLDALGDAIFGKYDGIQQLPPFVEVREHVNRIYHKTIWVWNYHNMTQTLKTCVQKISRDVDNVLSFIEFDDFSGSNEDMEYPFGYNYVFRPENRLIEISQPLPVEWEAFNKSPSFANYPLYQKIQGKSEQFIKFYKSRYDLIDMLENFVVDLYEPSIAPTTLNYAMIIGKSQYTTFNGLNYNFLSNCSYLLASDFKTKSFSLIVNYRNTTSSGKVLKSYEILSHDSSFEIFSEKHVTLNGKKVDLPIMHKQVTITREKDNIIAESSRGFKMICYFHYEYCTVQLSGWLFGKTAGLLGTLDNEQYTDVTTAQKTTNGVEQFLRSWQLQKNTECALQVAPDFQGDNLDYITQLCDMWFNDTKSPLNKCFDAVDPKMYSEICYNELRANPEIKVCAPAAAYVHRCRQARVAIEMPEFCVTCKNDIGYQEEIFDGHNNKTVDVVFITEMDCYNASLVTRALPELLDRQLLRKQFAGNRFATVGYGGAVLPKPHVHTHDGSVWSRSANVQIESRLSGINISAKSKFTGVDAIKYAANLEYRVGVPKLFVLTQCEVATDIGNSPDIYNMLGEKDITLHVLKPSPFASKQSPVLGVDLNTAIIKSNSSNTNIAVNQIINQIDDVYSGLALSTNGTIFDLTSLSANDDNSARWAHTLARHITASPCQKCKCVQDFNGVGKIECSRCLAPAVKQFLNEYQEGNKMQFNDNDDNQ